MDQIKMGIFSRYFIEGLLALLAVFLFTTIVLFASGAPPFAAYYQILKGSLGSWIKLAQVIKVWIPLTLCASGLLYTFRIGLWNIGVEGQIMLGAVCTTAVLRLGAAKSMPMLFVGLSFIAGIVGHHSMVDIRALATSRSCFYERNRTVFSKVMALLYARLATFSRGAGFGCNSPGIDGTDIALYPYGFELESCRE